MFVGKLCYEGESSGVYYFVYVVADYVLFTTSIKDLIRAMLGAIPSIWGILEDVLTDIINGVGSGAASRPRLDEILTKIPVTIGRDVPVVRLSYLQGGNEQYWICPGDLKLARVSTYVSSDIAILPSLWSLNIVGVEGVFASYKPEITRADRTPMDSDVYDALAVSGGYTAYIPNDSYCSANREWSDVLVGRWTTNTPYVSSHLVSYAGLLGVGGSGLYRSPGSTVQLTASVPQNGFVQPFFWDSGYDCSIPFSIDNPSDSVIEAGGCRRVSSYGQLQMLTGLISAPLHTVWGVGAAPIVVAPDYYVSVTTGLHSAHIVALCLLSRYWLKRG